MAAPPPLARLGLRADPCGLLSLSYLPADTPPQSPLTALAEQAVAELRRYLADPGNTFSIALQVHGTAFQRRVWRALQAIPPGRTLSYGQLAKQLDTSPRAIGNACRANPLPIVIPCHRVVAATGPGGYGGNRDPSCARIKHWLLEHERGHGGR